MLVLCIPQLLCGKMCFVVPGRQIFYGKKYYSSTDFCHCSCLHLLECLFSFRNSEKILKFVCLLAETYSSQSVGELFSVSLVHSLK